MGKKAVGLIRPPQPAAPGEAAEPPKKKGKASAPTAKAAASAAQPQAAPPAEAEAAVPAKAAPVEEGTDPGIPRGERRKMLGKLQYMAKKGSSGPLEHYPSLPGPAKRSFFWNEFQLDPSCSQHVAQETATNGTSERVAGVRGVFPGSASCS